MNRILNALDRIINAVQAWPLPDRFRLPILRIKGIRVGQDVAIFNDCLFLGQCEVGDGSFINARCTLDGYGCIKIGRNVFLATGVKLITSTHEIGPAYKRAGQRKLYPIVIGDGCWLGTDSLVLPGVTVAQGCIVAAGAVVAKDTEPNGLYVGVPARRVRDLAE